MTANSLIQQALKSIGVLAAGETLGASEATDCLTALNAMIDTWAIHHLTIAYRTRSTYALVAGTQTYSIGASGTFDQVRPVYLDGITIALSASPTIETRLEPYTEDEWRILSTRSQSGTPNRYYYRKTFPLAYLSFWPVPDAADTVAISWGTPLTEFATLLTDYDLAPGYREAIRYNLAVRLCPEFGRPLDPTVAQLAVETLGTIKRANITPMDMSVDAALLFNTNSAFNINTGE
jgi:hypothetical protein